MKSKHRFHRLKKRRQERAVKNTNKGHGYMKYSHSQAKRIQTINKLGFPIIPKPLYYTYVEEEDNDIAPMLDSLLVTSIRRIPEKEHLNNIETTSEVCGNMACTVRAAGLLQHIISLEVETNVAGLESMSRVQGLGRTLKTKAAFAGYALLIISGLTAYGTVNRTPYFDGI